MKLAGCGQLGNQGLREENKDHEREEGDVGFTSGRNSAERENLSHADAGAPRKQQHGRNKLYENKLY